MTTLAPTVKIQMIEQSLRCFTLGLLALIPVIGLPMIVMAEAQGWRLRRLSAGQWNPAGRYARWGILCARLGIVLLLVEILVIAAILITSWSNRDGDS